MKRMLAAFIVLTSLLSACATSGGNEAAPEPTTTTKGSSTTAGDEPSTTSALEPGARTIDWKDCGGGFQCGTITLPLDYSKPDGETIDIGVTRHPAEDPENRIGALFVNPGGPGGSAIDLARGFNRAGDIGDRFDIVGFDPRGVGESTPLDCHSHVMDIYDIDQSIDSDADRTAILDGSQAFIDECEEKYADLLPFVGTTDVAKDMDEIRKALGDEQLNYLGYSYGTSLGQEYARQFPTHVRSMILDGVVDHEPDGVTTAENQAAGFETALDSYIAHCQEDDCGFGGQDAGDVIAEVVASAEKAPIPAPDADRDAGPGVVSLALSAGLYSQQLWGQISSSLRDAQDGDGSGLVALADQYLTGASFEAYFAVGCLDEDWPSDPNEVLDASVAAEKTTPYFGGPIVSDYVRCAMWPAKAKPLKPIPSDIEGLPPILVVSTTKDPATPYENGVAVAKQIPGAVLLTNEGEGHTVVNSGKPCIDEAAFAYLLDLETPKSGTTCE